MSHDDIDYLHILAVLEDALLQRQGVSRIAIVIASQQQLPVFYAAFHICTVNTSHSHLDINLTLDIFSEEMD